MTYCEVVGIETAWHWPPRELTYKPVGQNPVLRNTSHRIKWFSNQGTGYLEKLDIYTELPTPTLQHPQKLIQDDCRIRQKISF